MRLHLVGSSGQPSGALLAQQPRLPPVWRFLFVCEMRSSEPLAGPWLTQNTDALREPARATLPTCGDLRGQTSQPGSSSSLTLSLRPSARTGPRFPLV